MEFYFILLLIITLQAFIIYKVDLDNIKNNDKVFLITALAILFFVSAFRANSVGADTAAYINLFESSSMQSMEFSIDRFEQGYMLFNNCIYWLSTNPQAILIATSFVTLFLFGYGIYKESANAWLSTYLFITLMFFYSTMNALRLNIALGIILYSYSYLKKGKSIYFFLLICIAASFHYTAITALILYPLQKIKITAKSVIAVTLLSITVFINIDVVFNIIFSVIPKYAVYMDSDFWREYTLAIYMQLALSMSIFFWGYYINYRYGLDNSNYFLWKITLLVPLFYLFALKAAILDRIAGIFFVFSILMIPNTLTVVKNKLEKRITIICVCIIAFCYNMIIFLYRPEWYMVFPHSFFWE